MGNGVVSEETIRLVDDLRKEGVKFVVVSGARTTTIMNRLPLLPRVDAAVSETGRCVALDLPIFLSHTNVQVARQDKHTRSRTRGHESNLH